MLEDVDYSEDKNFISIAPAWSSAEKKLVPVSFIDKLIERKLTSYDIEKLIVYRNLTRDGGTPHSLSELEGTDLEGKWVSFYFGNYEDSQWVSSEAVKTVKKEISYPDSYPTFSFVTGNENDACDNGTCEHDDTEWNSCSYGQENISIYSLSGGTEVFVGDIL
jgi:hypothetical protein